MFHEKRTIYFVAEDHLHVRIDGEEGVVVNTVENLHKYASDNGFGTKFYMTDSYGTETYFTFAPEPEEKDVYVVRSLTGSAHPAAGDSSIRVMNLTSKMVTQHTIAELAEIDFKKATPSVLAPKKKTWLADAGDFLIRLEKTKGGYILEMDSFEDVIPAMIQLSNAGITCRPHGDKPWIHIGENQPICWFLKLAINGLCDKKENYDKIMEDLLTRNIVQPVSPWTEEIRDHTYIHGFIYEGNNMKNRVPLLPPMKLDQTFKFYRADFPPSSAFDIQNTWYCS